MGLAGQAKGPDMLQILGTLCVFSGFGFGDDAGLEETQEPKKE